MEILRSTVGMRAACARARAAQGAGGQLGLVPTMGAIHRGHLSLVRAARSRCGVVAASIFVNPAQFAAGEDLEKYPRNFQEDAEVLEAAGVDLLFAPPVEEMYGAGAVRTFVEVADVGERLDGASRPGHFRGVATVVAKLFHIVGPDVAFFGQKDGAQVALLRAMVRDLDFGVEIVVCPTVRDADGMALSSRNVFLSAEERKLGLGLHQAVATAERMAAAGEEDAVRIREAMREVLAEARGLRVDYAEVVSAETLEPLSCLREGGLAAVAAWAGGTRLIDNAVLPAVREAKSEMGQGAKA